jgi:DNA-binding transcriptional MerR regulator
VKFPILEFYEDDLDILEQILIFKEMGFPLNVIKEIINNPSFEKEEALKMQHFMLLEKKKQIDQMLLTVEKTMKYLKGEIKMSNKEKFEDFNFSKNPYEDEARKRWGNETVDAANSRVKNISKAEKQEFGKKFNSVYKNLASIRHLKPDSTEAQAGIKEWFHLLNQMGNYSLEAFKNLGQMYVDDIRFTKNIDKFGEGLAKFMCEAMAVFSKINQK